MDAAGASRKQTPQRAGSMGSRHRQRDEDDASRGLSQTARAARHRSSSSQEQPRPPLSSRPPTSGDRRGSSASGMRPPAPPRELQPGAAPISSAAALKHHADCLTDYEQSEVFDYPNVYCLGAGATKIKGVLSSNKSNHGYDDERGDYNYVIKDHIGFRFEVLGLLGQGSFGKVLKCFDYKENRPVALKIIRNKKRFHHQALIEVRILEHLKHFDPEDQYNVIKMEEYFYFRNHLCITFELLSINLYEFIKNNNFQGVSLSLIRRFAIQLLTSLKYLHRERIIHCDLKPENILLKSPTKSGIKMIDFGSSCFDDERIYTYIQSRFYRSPEVILGISYGRPIDSWSFGCILAELYTGLPLFPGENEMEQLACIMEVMGPPPKAIVEACTRRKQFFDAHGAPCIQANSRGKKRRPGAKDLQTALHCPDASFISFLDGFLRWDSRERFTPDDGLRHPWILEGLVPSATRQPQLRRVLSSDGQRRPRRHSVTKDQGHDGGGAPVPSAGSSGSGGHPTPGAQRQTSAQRSQESNGAPEQGRHAVHAHHPPHQPQPPQPPHPPQPPPAQHAQGHFLPRPPLAGGAVQWPTLKHGTMLPPIEGGGQAVHPTVSQGSTAYSARAPQSDHSRGDGGAAPPHTAKLKAAHGPDGDGTTPPRYPTA
eukprot:TRINITY_DN6857_c0_g1_i3.p1 TRINITY_DN6857_c0_g1~~TRINITY_DN6857_c0_g1_i3.p1  ORF type:complete len:655 (+),score=202.07 TRINITY_DN6857_c0_g1_i3:124-2088(+)